MSAPSRNPVGTTEISRLMDRKQKYRFQDRFPDPAELVQWGGLPGMEYALVTLANLAEAQDEDWEEVKGLPAITVVGPRGNCQLKLMGRGEPTPLSEPSNGIRIWFIDPDAVALTGVDAGFGVSPLESPEPDADLVTEPQAPKE